MTEVAHPSADIVSLTLLPSHEDYRGAAYRIEGPIVDRLTEVGQVVLGFADPYRQLTHGESYCIQIDVFDPKDEDDASRLEYFEDCGYTRQDIEDSPNVIKFRQPIASEVAQTALRDYVLLMGKHQTKF